MTDSLYKLVYLSRNAISGDDELLHEEINAILAIARRNNGHADITGALIFNADRFAQVLEGSREALEETFERIQCDERHEQVTVLAFEAIAQRSFTHWSMAYLGRDTRASERFATLTRSTDFDAATLPEAHIHTLLREHLMEAGDLSVS